MRPPPSRKQTDVGNHYHRSSKNSGQRENTMDSTGPEGRVRGTARQIFEKYSILARDAVSAGDLIAAEGFFQHAEHYRRMLSDHPSPPSHASSSGNKRYKRPFDDGKTSSPSAPESTKKASEGRTTVKKEEGSDPSSSPLKVEREKKLREQEAEKIKDPAQSR